MSRTDDITLALLTLLSRKVPKLLTDPRRLRGALADLYSGPTRHARLHIALCELGVLGQLQAIGGREVPDARLRRWGEQVFEEYGYRPAEIRRALELWRTLASPPLRCSVFGDEGTARGAVVRYHYGLKGKREPEETELVGVLRQIWENPAERHLLWRAPWPSWRPWGEVAEVVAAWTRLRGEAQGEQAEGRITPAPPSGPARALASVESLPSPLRPGPVRAPVASLSFINRSGSKVEYPVASEIEITIGRSSGNSLRIRAPSLSRSHAKIVESNGQFVLMDLGTSNGTYLNGKRLVSKRPYPFTPGDKLKFGEVDARFELTAPARRPLAVCPPPRRRSS